MLAVSLELESHTLLIELSRIEMVEELRKELEADLY